MITIDPATLLQDLYRTNVGLRSELDKGLGEPQWSVNMRMISLLAQGGALDPVDSENYLKKYRGFVNVGPNDAVVTINGERHTLTAGLTYCADPSEIQTMLVQSLVHRLGLSLGTLADFQANPGVDSFYS